LNKKISISVVSHHQAGLVSILLEDIARFVGLELIEEIIVTINEPEAYQFDVRSLPIKIIENESGKGFAENHNNAFNVARGDFFCVINPDIRLKQNPFPELLSLCSSHQGITVPVVFNKQSMLEDSLRTFPTPLSLFLRLFGIGKEPMFTQVEPISHVSVDWAGGMFLLFSRESFQAVEGFDEKFFLYYEDVDICARMWKANRPVVACTKVQVIHDAQRQSHRSLRYFKWHLLSMSRYFYKHWLRLPKTYAANQQN